MQAREQILQRTPFLRALSNDALIQIKLIMNFLLAVSVGALVWNLPPPSPLDAQGMHFLATLSAAVTLWSTGILDEYIVALLLLLSWMFFGIVPSKLAVAGFSNASWFFVLGAMGNAAAVGKSGLLQRTVDTVLRSVPPNLKFYIFSLGVTGFLVTPVLPSIKARISIVSPMTQVISERVGLLSRSNASASLALAGYLGFSQLTFVFLTGANTSFVGWSLMPTWAQSEFGWFNWTLAALPAGVFFLLFMCAALLFLFPPNREELARMPQAAETARRESSRPLSKNEWISAVVLVSALTGWLTAPLHGISEAWVALGALAIFLITGVLEKKDFHTRIDWGFLIFFGVAYGIAGVSSHLKIDRWLMTLAQPFFAVFSGQPTTFLMAILTFVYFARVFLDKTPIMLLFGLGFMSLAQNLGIHPGALVLTMLLACEMWFLPYQAPSYLMAYQASNGQAFSHAQGRKLMLMKLVASFIAVAMSVPYWKFLGLIH